MASGRRLYLHVGTRKSGTSFLQRTVYESLPALAEQGLGVPFPSWVDHYNGLYRTLLKVEEGQPLSTEVTAGLAQARRRCDRTEGDRLLLTFEDLAALSPTHVRAVLDTFDGYDVHLVVTVRDLARQLPSEWQQCVKERLLIPYEEYVGAVRSREGADADLFWSRQDVDDIIGRWSRDVDDDNLHVLVVPPSSADRSLLPGLFFGLLGIDPSTLSYPTRSINPSLGFAEAETLRRINIALGDRLPDFRGEYRVAVRRVLRGPLLQRKGVTPAFPAEHAEWVHEESRRQADRLAARQCDLLGSVEDLVSVVEPRPGDKASVSDAEVAEVAVGMIADLAVEQVEGRKRQPKNPPQGQRRPPAAKGARGLAGVLRRIRRA